MSRRVSVLAVIAAVVVTTLGPVPAYAEVAADPVITDVATTPGHVTGTVTSAAPYVSLRLATNVPGTLLTLSEGSATFDLETWGYGGTTDILATACAAVEPTPDCSTEIAAATFTPTDVVPDITWPLDTTVGPADTPTVTVSDPEGGGTLHAVWVNSGEGGNLDTELDRNGETALNLSQGTGFVHVVRCAAANSFNCVGFDPELTQNFIVRTTAAATVDPIAPLTSGNPTSTASIDTDLVRADPGAALPTYELDWELRDIATGTVYPGGTAEVGSLDADGNIIDAFTIDAGSLPEGEFDVDVSLTLTSAEFGMMDPVVAQGYVVVDRTGPSATLTRSVGTIYPLVGTAAYPALTRIDVDGDATPITGFVVRSGGGTVVRHLPLNVSTTTWNGRNDAGKVVDKGTYGIRAVDADGNLGASVVSVTVSRQTLVLKKLVRDVTASGSMYDKFVGRCSILKSRSSRFTLGSLGYFSNARCGTQTFAASAVSTAHAFQVPALPGNAKPVDMRVDVVGGASLGRAGSRGVLRYLTLSGNWAYETPLKSAYGIHRGPTTSVTKFLDKNRFVIWGFVTAYRSYYDVTRFTVVIRYYGLSAAG